MKFASLHRGSVMVGLPSTVFFHRMGLSYHRIHGTDKTILILDVQDKIRKIDNSVVIGLDAKHDKVYWYAVPEGKKPHTQVPFFFNVQWPEGHFPNPVEQVDSAIWHDIYEQQKEVHRVIAGVSLPRKPWYARPSKRR